MSLIHYENWDGVTAPALPANWTAPAFVTHGTVGAVAPTSSPNLLEYAPGGTAGTYFATYATADSASGNVIVQSNINLFQATGLEVRLGVTARGSAYPLDDSTTSCYAAWLDYATGLVGISTVISGTETTLNSHSAPIGPNYWYVLIFTLFNTSLQLQVQDLSDGYWLDSSGSFVNSPATAISITDSTLTGSGYAGLYVVQEHNVGGFDGCSDDWYFSTITADRPFVYVVPVPYQHFPSYAE